MIKPCNPEFPEDIIAMGKLGSTYGIRGWLRIFSSTSDAASIFDYQPWFIQRSGQWQQIELEDWKHHNQNLIVKVKTVDDRESAKLLNNLNIFVDATHLPPLGAGEYYWKDLIGCQVVTISGYGLGKVVDMMETGSNDVMVVKAALKDRFGIQERLLPFLEDQVIKKIDLTAKRIEVDWDPDFS